ncbi:MAG: tRNA (adenosine(37)-N6)-threonylcarbamoyltransferase complex dimerization subunit type 1 TsaB [Limnochordia bacterium]
MRTLGLDTSTSSGGAALLVDGVARSECSFNMGAVHSERLLPTIEHVMRDANTTGDELDVIAVTVGPGSFTGLRVGVTTAKVLAYGWKKPIVPVNTLEALAWQVAGLTGLVVAALNARRGTAYAAVYRVTAGASSPPVVVHPPDNLPMSRLLDELADVKESVAVVGDGRAVFSEMIEASLGERWLRLPSVAETLRPASVASLGSLYFEQGVRVSPFSLLPTYLRKAEAERKWEKAHRP